LHHSFEAPNDTPGAAKSKTLTFDVVFSSFTLVAGNNVRNPKSPTALGGEIVEHDQLVSGGQHAGDDLFSCVVVSAPPAATPGRLRRHIPGAGGDITAQTTAVPGPSPKDLALPGGAGTYRNIGGDATLAEFGARRGEADAARAEPCSPRRGSLTQRQSPA